MTEVAVIRAHPANLARCRAKECRAMVEWVTVEATGRKMPVTHPLVEVRVHERGDRSLLTIIDGAQAHFTTCPGAQSFRKESRSRRRAPSAPRLFD